MAEIIGQGMVDILVEKKNMLVKVSRAEEKQIAAHYRKELERMKSGGVFEFDSWQ